MKRLIRILEVMVFAVLIFSGYAAAAQNMNVYKGELIRDSAKAGNLGSNELWLLYGEKGTHMVITTVVDKGNAPPEIYLYPPGGGKSEMHSDMVSDRSQVLDYKLNSTGKYEVLIRPCDQQEKTGYRVAYTTLAPGNSYTIQPDDPNGNLIVQENPDKSGSSKIIISRSGGLVPASILLDMVTFGTGPILFALFTGIDGAFVGTVDLNNRIEVASRAIDEPTGQCNIMVSGIASR
jgi:hypothetical protein